MDARTSPFRLRITQMREVLVREGVQALLVPSSDPHLSEYLPEHWQGRQWLSGFTGSMGTLVVSLERAMLFADGRYWMQAEAELDGSGIELVRIASASAPAHVEWLASQLPAGAVVAVDGQVLALAAHETLQQALSAAGMALRTEVDLLDSIWPERPALPAQPVRAHLPPQASQARGDRLAAVRAAMAAHGATHHLVSTVDDIAWLSNLRGSDVAYNPVFIAHLLLEAGACTLFVGAGKVDAELQRQLAADGVQLADYAEAPAALGRLDAGSTLLVDPRRVTWGLRSRVGAGCRVVHALNPSTLLKSRKSAQDIAFVRETMAQDGAAMCEFYAGFEAALARGDRLTEIDIDEQLAAARARRPGFVGLSFPTIAGIAGHGAMPHYRATEETNALIQAPAEGGTLLLIDSGGQYLGGTTDITRVWPVGSVNAAMRRDYTLVLKGMLALSRARFPRSTPGPMLDALARAPLWAEGIEYSHGTGHGVGYFLNVHEGPQTISKAAPEPHTAMEPGMITSIEPGVYRPGRWGVRIENLVLTVPASTPEDAAFGEFLAFETLTLCPIDTRCIERALLHGDEIDWLNGYHATVRSRLAPLLDGAALAWLEQRTQAF